MSSACVMFFINILLNVVHHVGVMNTKEIHILYSFLKQLLLPRMYDLGGVALL